MKGHILLKIQEAFFQATNGSKETQIKKDNQDAQK